MQGKVICRLRKKGKGRRTWQQRQDVSLTYTPKAQSEGSQPPRKQLKKLLRQEAFCCCGEKKRNKNRRLAKIEKKKARQKTVAGNKMGEQRPTVDFHPAFTEIKKTNSRRRTRFI